MDPLSAGASVIAVIQVTAQCAKLLTTVIITLRDAPEDILALSNEVSDLNLVLTEVASTTPSPNVLKLINRANAMLRILESLLREWMRPHGTGGEVKFERFAWFRHSKKARVLQAQLRELKLGIVAGLVSGQTIQSTKMSFSLDTLTMSVQQTAEDLDRFSKSHDESKKTLEKILETVSPVNFVREQQEDHGDTIKQILTTVLRLEGKDPFSSSESDSGYSSAPSASPLLVPTEAGTDPPAWGTPSVGLSCSQYQRTPCSVACNCSCHRRARIGSPSVAQRVFGLLFVSYSMLPQRVDRCDVPACKNRSPTKTRITYYFPQWMFLKAINISITKSYFFEPSLQLTMKRIISPVSPIFIAVKEGRIDVIKQLFEKRLASPNDIEGLDGDGVLHIAINEKRADVCRLLLSAGADPESENRQSYTAMQQAWLTVLGKKTDIATRGTFTELFHDHDALQEFQFSPVHRIVLELNSSIKLSDYLSLTVSEINCIDSMGRTPLSWAAIRSDAESVKTLLKFGANAEVSNRGGVTPTHSSASCNDPAVLKALVDSGVNIAIQDRSGLTPLHWAATYGSVEHLKILRDAGADINALDSYSVTSLCMASMMGKTANAKFLLDNGANIKIADWDGDSPLFTSVLYNQYDVLRLLLERGADIAAKNSRGRTILHVVASRGDATTCKILAKRKWMEVVDTDLRDCDGKLAEELVHERLTVDQEFLEEFCKLIRWTRECLQAKIMGVDLVAPKEEDSGTGSLDYSSDVDSDEEEFWDAEE